MTLEQLKHFHETARRGHVGQAAIALRISPSAIIYSIRCLEDELGSKLFIKKGKRIFLSAKGEALVEKIPKLFTYLEEIKEGMLTQTSSIKGQITIAATPVLSEKLLIKELAQIQEKHTLLHAEVLSKRSSDVISLVQNAQVDMGICFSPFPHPEIESKLLFKGQMKIYFRKSHPLTKVKKFDLTMLNHYPCVLPKALGGVDVCERNPVFEQYKIILNSHVAFDSYGVAIQYIKCSNSWSLMPEIFSDDLASAKVPKNWNAPYTVELLWNKSRGLNSKSTLIMEALKAKFCS